MLEVLINANQIGLEVSEIEGDAILFYKFGDPPGLEELYKQVEKMFCEFHKNLIAYDNRRYCQCKACLSAIDLTLKVITHYGEFTGYNVKNFSKLIGKDIIIDHFLPRVGMRCRCIRENGEVITYASSYYYQPDRIEFSETDEKKKSSTFYILEKTANKKTKLTLDYYLEKNWIMQILFNLTRKKKMEDEFHQSLLNLDRVVKEIKLPV